jgi:TonB-linked SusC/RagA family outer membrane protein
MIGTSILVKGEARGTVTDADGKFSIELAEGGTLVIRFVGYKTQEITPQGTELNLELVEDFSSLNEVVVVGFAIQEKKEISGNISKVKGSELTMFPVTSFETALQGKAPGVQVIQGSGLAGSGAVIRVRGISSVSAGGDPLYVIDGVPITNEPFLNGNRGAMNYNPLATINPNDIESVEILKDASAQAIYGSRGANGVILITTKRGASGKLRVNFGARFATSNPTRITPMLNNREWLQLYQEAWENDGGVGRAALPGGISWEDAQKTNTDWVGLTTRTGFKQDYNLSLSYGTQKLKAYFGFQANGNQSYLVGNSYDRLSFRGNLDYELTKDLKVSLSTSYSRGDNWRVPSAWDGGLGSALSTALPFFPVKTNDSTYFTNGSNPVRQRDLLQWRTRENRTINSINLDWNTPIKGLSFTGNFGVDYMDMSDEKYTPRDLGGFNHNGLAERWPNWVTNYNSFITANYKYDISEKHKLKFQAGLEYQKNTREFYNFINSTDANGPFWSKPSFGNNRADNRQVGQTESFSFLGRFFRATYSFNEKLYVNAIMRVDASSRFGKNYRNGYFPSIGASYLLHRESFMESFDWLSNLRLRAGFGATGNANALPANARYFIFSNTGLPYNGDPVINPSQYGNDDLKWEISRMVDAGLDLGLFDDRIKLDFSVYNKRTSDVLISRRLQLSSGYGEQFTNVGVIENRGVDIALTTRNMTGRFKWTSEFVIGWLRNRVLDVGTIPPDAIAGSGDTRVVVGHPVGVNFLNRFHRVDPNNGLPIFLDKDGNETYQFRLNDRVITGSVVPDAVGSFTNRFSYKGFDLEVFFTYTIGGNIYDDAAKRQLGIVSDWNMRRDITDRWTQPGDQARFPRLTLTPQTYGGLPSFWNLNTTQFLYDGSFLRLRNLSLGYNVPSAKLSQFRISGLRVYLGASNLLTFTHYPGVDPEMARDMEGMQGRNISPNVTYLTPPQERSFYFGFNVQF